MHQSKKVNISASKNLYGSDPDLVPAIISRQQCSSD
jgi:hypothetical protein